MPASPYQYAHTIFQFHKGTIKTVRTISTDLEPYAFQFHKGTIKTLHLSIIVQDFSISIP